MTSARCGWGGGGGVSLGWGFVFWIACLSVVLSVQFSCYAGGQLGNQPHPQPNKHDAPNANLNPPQVVSDEVGANCVIAAATPPPSYPPGKEPIARPRFQEGARDEVRSGMHNQLVV